MKNLVSLRNELDEHTTDPSDIGTIIEHTPAESAEPVEPTTEPESGTPMSTPRTDEQEEPEGDTSNVVVEVNEVDQVQP